MKLLGSCIIWGRLFYLTLFNACLLKVFPGVTLLLILPTCNLLHLTLAETVTYFYHHIWLFLFFSFKKRNVIQQCILQFLVLMPILFLARSAIQFWHPLGKYNKQFFMPYILQVLCNPGAPALDQDSFVLRDIEREQRQFLGKNCGLRITSLHVSYKLENQHNIIYAICVNLEIS